MYSKKKIHALLQKVESLEKNALNIEAASKDELRHIHPDHKDSARNLLHYLAIRSHDLRSLQKDLSVLAISSNGHAESYALSSLQKIKYLLSALAGTPLEITDNNCLSYDESATQLKNNTTALLGRASFNGETKIMVTLPTEAADDYNMVLHFIKKGMQIARINTAHDTPELWEQMILNIRKAADATGKDVKLYMDMEGPKIRTGKIKQEHAIKDGTKVKDPCIHLYKGSKITLIKADLEGTDGKHPKISLTLPEVFGQVKLKESVWFDDGKIGGMISEMNDDNIVVTITHAPEDGVKLKAEKGVNFPDSDLDIPALTDEDLDHLAFIAQYADMVGFSFVQKPEDVFLLQKHLKRLKREDMGIIMKIETHLAFENFPALLLAAMRSRVCGVMIARGDLAVAIGYERIAEVQEEILWLAEAAHLPVIWATQVLETKIKKGMATRAEISDVVKAVRAECVMLNKGPHVLEAIDIIRDIDKRMAAHEDKKQKLLRSLHVARSFVGLHKTDPILQA